MRRWIELYHKFMTEGLSQYIFKHKEHELVLPYLNYPMLISLFLSLHEKKDKQENLSHSQSVLRKTNVEKAIIICGELKNLKVIEIGLFNDDSLKFTRLFSTSFEFINHPLKPEGVFWIKDTIKIQSLLNLLTSIHSYGYVFYQDNLYIIRPGIYDFEYLLNVHLSSVLLKEIENISSHEIMGALMFSNFNLKNKDVVLNHLDTPFFTSAFNLLIDLVEANNTHDFRKTMVNINMLICKEDISLYMHFHVKEALRLFKWR
jgi:hypothetical protein